MRENALTDASGLIHLPELETGTYIIAEIKAPDGYVIDDPPKTVELREGQTYEVTFSNTKRSGLTIRKIDEDTRQPLKNAIFSILPGQRRDRQRPRGDRRQWRHHPDGTPGLHTDRDRDRGAGRLHFAGHAQDHRGQGGWPI